MRYNNPYDYNVIVQRLEDGLAPLRQATLEAKEAGPLYANIAGILGQQLEAAEAILQNLTCIAVAWETASGDESQKNEADKQRAANMEALRKEVEQPPFFGPPSIVFAYQDAYPRQRDGS